MKHTFLVGLALAACGGGSGGGAGSFGVAADEAAGIYRIDDLTRNEDACGPGGVSIVQQDMFVVAVRQQGGGLDLLNLFSCASPQDCRDKAADRDGFSLDFSFTVQFLGDGGALTGAGASTGFGDGQSCTAGESFETVLTLTDDQLRLEKRITVANDYPADSEGFCTTDLARAAAAGNSCSIMEVLTATLVEEL
jgi:hypothetical protein